jgi:N-terminal domain of anti-restriction factor ArdC
MNTATIDNQPTTNSRKTPSTKQELIAANIKLLIEQLEAGHSDALTNYLTAMSRFHNYSFGNVLEIARQMPTATRVAGFWTWKNLGRSVNAGAKGIRILAPIVGVRRKKDEEAQKDITKQNTRTLLGFRNAYVFDVSQTNGVDLPEIHEVSGDPGENVDRLAAFLKAQDIQLVYNAKIAPALGISYGGRIAILPGQSKAEEFSTLVHETAHEMLHKAERRTATTKTVRETEAEAVAFVVGKAVGLVTGNASADYIQLYHGNASLLAESLEVIQQTASVILAALEPPIEDSAAEPQTAEADAELAEAA